METPAFDIADVQALLDPAPGPDWLIEPVTFWMVWTKTGHMPRYFHHSREGAETEARRLALRHPGLRFIVLEAVTKVSVTPPVVAEAA